VHKHDIQTDRRSLVMLAKKSQVASVLVHCKQSV